MRTFSFLSLQRQLGTRCLWLALSTLWPLAATARADSGVSDERVALPDGPGSLAGAGDNLPASGNLGAMVDELPFDLPRGFAGATPSLALRYSSMNGSSELGIGWALGLPHIARLTLRGLPEYGPEDVFAADGSDELVRVSGSGDAHVYRARFEGSFVRYTWHRDATGAAGYWEAEYPDGSRGFFGADASGQTVESARVTHPDGGVFRYMLVETEDVFGHRVRYEYGLDGAYPIIERIAYVFTGGVARYRVQFEYEDRLDELSNALPGFDLRLTKRLSRVQVMVGGATLREYRLHYEDAAGGISRLHLVRQLDADGRPFPLAFRFAYSAPLDLGCADCTRPSVHDMGQLQAGDSGGVDLQNGLSTLLDINGDALPDLLDSTPNGQHRFFINTLAEDGTQSFSAPRPSALTPRGSSFVLNAPAIQVVDVNGDGHADMIDAIQGRLLCNLGDGDWVAQSGACGELALGALLQDDPTETGEANPRGMRFMDYDGDRRMDLLHTLAIDGTLVWHNTPAGFQAVLVDPVGKVFDDASALQLADLNGDGLLDPVEVSAGGQLWYRLNLGFGRWSRPVQSRLQGATSTLEDADFQDLNGDGLDDVVLVHGNTVQFALNRAGTFLPFQSVQSAQVRGELPTLTDQTTVLFADMNGSGTTDVVWVESGHVRFLELFALRPNLLTGIDNGIGGVKRVQYGTSVQEQARDAAQGLAWRHHMPQAMTLVTAIESFATLMPDVKMRMERSYHHGFYDGVEKRYRGFETIVERTPGDATQQTATRELQYDVGETDAYRQGRLLRERVFAEQDGARTLLQRVLYTHGDCPVAGLPDEALRRPVRHVCLTQTETLLQEGRPEPEWVTLRSEQQYDAYGQVVRTSDLGVVGMGETGAEGCGACTAPAGTHSGPCGAQCRGDETYTETQYVTPIDHKDGRWQLGVPWRRIGRGDPGGPTTETLYYYDGDPFIGLPRGTLTKGLLTRQCERLSPDAAEDCEGTGWVYQNRALYDLHGNVVTSLDPLGDPAADRGHRRVVEYDADGLKVTAVELALEVDGAPYRLRREVTYDPLFDQPAAVTRWMLQGHGLQSERGETRIGYDSFGRRSRVARPGDTLQAPTQTFHYELTPPVSRIVVSTRSQPGGAPDLEQLACVDGLGRTLQTRTRLTEGLYQVDGFNEANAQGSPVRIYQGYQGGRNCDTARPASIPFSSYYYDAVGRPLRVTAPDESLYGQASVSSTVYGPLWEASFDPEDNDPDSPAYLTPHRRTADGLGRVVRLERDLEAGRSVGTVHALWDDLGQLAGYVDAHGNQRRQLYDLGGRLVQVDDPNAGITHFTYDAAGNLTARTDATGTTVRTLYDGANRQIEQFDAENPEGTRVKTRYDFAADCDDCENAEGQVVAQSYPLGAGVDPGRDEYGFDLRGRNVMTARTLEGHRFVTTAHYDSADRVTHLQYPDGTTLTHGYDGASRLVSISGILDDTEFDARGLPTSWHYANGTRLVQEHDVLQRLRSSRTHGADGTVLQGFGYQRDRVGNVFDLEDLADARPGALGFDVTFRHDAWYRMTRADFGAGQESIDLAFDGLDNITRKVSSLGARSPAHVGDYTLDGRRPNAVTEAGPLDFEHDSAGRVTRRGDTRFAWDHLGRLKHAAAPDGREATYTYGAGVERVIERHDGGVTYHIGPNFELRDGIAVTYARLGRQRVARLSSTALAAVVLDDPNGDTRVDVADAWLTERQGRRVTTHLRASARRLLLEASGARVFLQGDHLGSVTLATSDDGAVRGEQAFYPTGALRRAEGYVDHYGFTGQRRDPTTDLTHFAFRQLDTVTGRWVSPDPAFAVSTPELLGREGEATTAYAYVAGWFATRKDPSGLIVEHRSSSSHGWGTPLSLFHHAPKMSDATLYQAANVIGSTLDPNSRAATRGSIYYVAHDPHGSGVHYGRVTLNHPELANNGRGAVYHAAHYRIENGYTKAHDGSPWFSAQEFENGKLVHSSRSQFRPVIDGADRLALHATAERLGSRPKLSRYFDDDERDNVTQQYPTLDWTGLIKGRL